MGIINRALCRRYGHKWVEWIQVDEVKCVVTRWGQKCRRCDKNEDLDIGDAPILIKDETI